MNSEVVLVSYITSDKVEYLLDFKHFGNHSRLVKDLEIETTTFNNLSSQQFKYIVKYLELRKSHPEVIQLPQHLYQCDLKDIISQWDFDLVDQITTEGKETYYKVIDASVYLQIDYLQSILLAGIALKLISKTPKQLRDHYGLNDLNENEKNQFRDKLQQMLKEIRPH